MVKTVHNTLQFDLVLNLIEPVGESGRHFRHQLPFWKPGQEALLRKEFIRLEALISAILKNKKTTEQFRSALIDLPWLPQTLKALQERPLFLHECFELKKLLYYAIQLKEICQKHSLAKHYPFPDLEKPYALLDPEHKNSPAFALNAAFDPRLAQYIARLQDLQLLKRQAEAQLMHTAKQDLRLSQAAEMLVISRLQTAKLNKLKKSSYYQLADENYANLTFKLKDTKLLTALKKQISALSVKLAKAEESVLNSLSKKLKTHTKALLRTAELICLLDWDFAKAVFAIRYNCVIPMLSNKIQLNLSQAINLPVQQNLAQSDRSYQPVDLHFSTHLNVLTGPNMGGKTTALKTAGQLCLMAQSALPVPAAKAELCLFDHIWYNQDTAGEENLSSFGREIVSLAYILKKKGRNLLLMDELAKGTNPAEGEAILIAVMEYVHKQSCLTLAATHYDQPALLKSAAHYTIRGIDTKALAKLLKTTETGLNAQLDLLNSLMDYSLIKLTGKAVPPQNAIPVAEVLGLPAEIITRARKLLV
jgi:DNA mismatch repair protein MutS2